MLVLSRFACAFIDAMLLTTEKEAIELFLLEYEPASLRAASGSCGRSFCWGSNRKGSGFFNGGALSPPPHSPWPAVKAGDAAAMSGSRQAHARAPGHNLTEFLEKTAGPDAASAALGQAA